MSDHRSTVITGVKDPQEIQQLYNIYSDTYDTDLEANHSNGNRQMLEMCLKHLKTTDLILDVAGGTGEAHFYSLAG